jgi:hypothetical protein
MDYTNYKVYFTNTLQIVKQIIEKVATEFVEYGFTTVKMQLRFGVIWEGLTVEAENHEIISKNTEALINSLPLLSSSSSSSSSSHIIDQLKSGRRYYPQNVYQTNFQKYPLLIITHKTFKKDIQPFIHIQLKDLQNKSSDTGESNHRIIAEYNIQCFLYDVGKPIGGKQGMKSIVIHPQLLSIHFVSSIVYHI